LVFYILPFFCFWAGVAGLLLKNSSWAVDVPRLIRSAGTFIACGMVLPVITFLVFGKVVGYGRYWHSLFGMGFEYLYIWDHGIWAQARAYLNNMLREKKLIVVALMYYFPLVVNGMSIVAMIRQYFPRSWGLEQTKEFLVIASMGIIGILLFFPLEGYHILSTKMFIFCFVGFYLIACFCDVWIKRFTPVFLILTVLFVGMFLMKPFKILKEDWTMGTDRIHRPIGLKMPLQLALELEKQAAVIERGVQGNPYYLLDGDGQTLSGILVFVNNLHTEYYFEMRPGIMNQSVVDEVLKAIRQLSYVVVNSENYRQYMAHESMDPLMKQILDYVSGYFTVVDEYEAPPKISSHTAMVLGFVVMKRN
jgi:fumarate reductase subunit C